jgi:hypothetical protein
VELLPKFLNHHSPTWQEAVREELEMKEHKRAVAKTVLNLSLGQKSEVQKRWTEISHGIINENNLRHAHARALAQARVHKYASIASFPVNYFWHRQQRDHFTQPDWNLTRHVRPLVGPLSRSRSEA